MSPLRQLQVSHLAVLVATCFASHVDAQDENQKVKADRERFEAKEDWLYNDLNEAYRRARASGKPIMAVLRCIPCEECVKLDDELVQNDPLIAPLLKKFVLLRLTGTNGLDLKTFQYDTDQSFAVFFFNADKTVYGRFGTRSHRTDWLADVSVEGMAVAMKRALLLHAKYPANKSMLAAKSNQPTLYNTPEQFPTLRNKPGRLNWKDRDFAEAVVKNCIHCHEIGEARIEHYWQLKEPIPESVLYPYPHPKSIGLILDPEHAARVKQVTSGSAAEKSGLQTGDDIIVMNGQPLISMADVQWVLHHLPAAGAKVDMTIQRGDSPKKLSLHLDDGWRRADDTSWRTGHWILRRSMLGGMKLEQKADKDSGQTRLVVGYLGSWGPFGVAKRAGAMQGDIIRAVDRRADLRRESEVFEYINRQKQRGDQVELTLQRGDRTLTVRYKIQ